MPKITGGGEGIPKLKTKSGNFSGQAIIKIKTIYQWEILASLQHKLIIYTPVLMWGGASVGDTPHCPMPIKDHTYHKSKEDIEIKQN